MSQRMIWSRPAMKVLLVAAVVACVSLHQAVEGRQGRQPADQPEVVFIAANHNLTFLHPGFTPAHIRALLSKIHPAALCLEVLPDWDRRLGIPSFPQEQYAAMTWAERAGVPVYGVNWATPEVQALPPIERMRYVDLVERGPQFEQFREEYRQTVLWTALRAFAESTDDLESLQRGLPAAVESWPSEETGAAIRDDRIAENIRAVVARYPGQRIAAVFGTYHYLPQKRRLAEHRIRVVSAVQYLPLDAERIDAGWHPDDAVVLLGTNLDDWRILGALQSRNHQRTKELLDRMKGERPNSVLLRYYDARWRMLLGDLEAASPALERLAREGTTTAIPYLADARWCWPPFRTYEQRARFYLGVAFDLAGEHETALSHYRALLRLSDDELAVPALIGGRRVDLRPYLESLVKTPFRAGVFEAFRAAVAMGR